MGAVISSMGGKQSSKVVGVLGDRCFSVLHAGCENACFIPEHRRDTYVKHITKWRPSLCNEAGNLIWDEEHAYEIVQTINGRSTYVSDTAPDVVLRVGWELEKEMQYQFTTVPPKKELVFDEQLMLEAIDINHWIFAKSMPENPHCYALRKVWNPAVMSFDEFTLIIRKFGRVQRYWKQMYKVLDIGDFFYWTMGAPLTITILINRKSNGEML